jgi:hypothetical protein
MVSEAEDIFSELKTKRKVDDFFYPGISMDIQIPDGLKGEISGITRLLGENNFETDSSNVFNVMKLKKKLLNEYTSNATYRENLNDYKTLMQNEVKPIGSPIPFELLLVDGLTIIFLSVIARFGLSFANEAGKIVARKILDGDKGRQARKYNMTLKEYRFLMNETIKWIQEKKTLVSFAKKMRKRKRTRKDPKKVRQNPKHSKTT